MASDSSGKPPFVLAVDLAGAQPVVRLTGEVDMATSPAVKETLSELVEGGHLAVVVDLSEVTFMDSSGLHVLVDTQHRLSESGGKVVLRKPGPAVDKLLDASGYGTLFDTERGENDRTQNRQESK